MYKNDFKARSVYQYINLALLAVLLFTVWPVIPFVVFFILCTPFLDRFVEKYCVYEKRTEIPKYEQATGMIRAGIFLPLGMVVAFFVIDFAFKDLHYIQEVLTPLLNGVSDVFTSYLNNLQNGNILSNFKLFLTPNPVLIIIYMDIACFVSAYLFYRLEKSAKERAANTAQPDGDMDVNLDEEAQQYFLGSDNDV